MGYKRPRQRMSAHDILVVRTHPLPRLFYEIMTNYYVAVDCENITNLLLCCKNRLR